MKKKKKKKNKNEKEMSEKKTELPLIKSSSPLSSFLSLKTWSKFVPRRFTATIGRRLYLIFRYIYTTTYIFVGIIFQQSLLSRAHLFVVRAHKQTQRWPRDQQQQRGDDDDDDEKNVIARLIDLEEDLFPMRTTETEQQRRTKERTE